MLKQAFQFILLLLIAGIAFSCKNEELKPNEQLSLEAFQSLRQQDYALNSNTIRDLLVKFAQQDPDRTTGDVHTRKHYLNSGSFLWIDRHGIDQCADTVIKYLKEVDKIGFSPNKFYVNKLEEDLERLRTLHVDSTQDINLIAARLEYRLTKAFMRYVIGQRFGYVNPSALYNKLDVRDSDSTGRVKSYRGLFDIKIEHPDSSFYAQLSGLHTASEIGQFLQKSAPTSSLYKLLYKRYNSAETTEAEKKLLAINMERARWRTEDSPEKHKKYVMVNIPAYALRAVDGDSVLEMRIGCGTFKTKTPLLSSEIMRMDVNPLWVIPPSIIKNEVAHHAGNPDYFYRHRYFIKNFHTGKNVSPAEVTPAMLRSMNYRVVQAGGPGNSLGRIIFRFPNNFSVFLHDTSSPGFFTRDRRGVSHGCVRIQKPYEFAVFLLKDKDPKLLERIHTAMTADSVDTKRFIRSVKVDPKIPLFINYYTIYPDPSGHLITYPDVYKYDEVMANYLRYYR